MWPRSMYYLGANTTPDKNGTIKDNVCSTESESSSMKVPTSAIETEARRSMQSVHLKHTQDDFQVVPDFSDLMQTIADDMGKKTWIIDAKCKSEQCREVQQRPSIENEKTPGRRSERDELEIYLNQSLLTPLPVERLYSTLDADSTEVFRFPSPLVSDDEKPESIKLIGGSNSDAFKSTSIVTTTEKDSSPRINLASSGNECREFGSKFPSRNYGALLDFADYQANVNSGEVETERREIHCLDQVPGPFHATNNNNNAVSWKCERSSSLYEGNPTVYVEQDMNNEEFHDYERQSAEGNTKKESRETCLLPTQNSASWRYGTSTVLSSSLGNMLNPSSEGAEDGIQHQIHPVPWNCQTLAKTPLEMETLGENDEHSDVCELVALPLLESPSASSLSLENQALNYQTNSVYFDESANIKDDLQNFKFRTREQRESTQWSRPSPDTTVSYEFGEIQTGLSFSESAGYCFGPFPKQSQESKFPPHGPAPAIYSGGRTVEFPPFSGTNQIAVEEQEYAFAKSGFTSRRRDARAEHSSNQELNYDQGFSTHMFTEDSSTKSQWSRKQDTSYDAENCGQCGRQTITRMSSNLVENNFTTRKHVEARQIPKKPKTSSAGNPQNDCGITDGYTENDCEGNLRTFHNDMEKQRRCNMKNRFENLRAVIPDLREKPRAPKIVILSKAKNYVDALGKESVELERIIKEEKERNKILLNRLQQAMTHMKEPDSC